jgi:hypothetical protein
LEERFAEKYEPEPNTGCWIWTGHERCAGYGGIQVDGRAMLAHRVAYEMFVGPIPVGMEIDHKCRVTFCVNPTHLEPVTHRENVERGALGGLNRAKTHCPQGHPYDGDNLFMQSNGSRTCRACRRANVLRYRRRRLAEDPTGFRKKNAAVQRAYTARRRKEN